MNKYDALIITKGSRSTHAATRRIRVIGEEETEEEREREREREEKKRERLRGRRERRGREWDLMNVIMLHFFLFFFFISNPLAALGAHTSHASYSISNVFFIATGPKQFEFHPVVSIFKLNSLDVLLRN